ncbi:MAG: hypothetical protein WA652_12805, partial [Xanthobacteraceae bacterium]
APGLAHNLADGSGRPADRPSRRRRVPIVHEMQFLFGAATRKPTQIFVTWAIRRVRLTCQ